MLHNPAGCGAPAGRIDPSHLAAGAALDRAGIVTDGLIHLAYAAQVTNTRTTPADITGVVPLDPLADFSPTGRNFVTDD